jgi:hypothetical protein
MIIEYFMHIIYFRFVAAKIDRVFCEMISFNIDLNRAECSKFFSKSKSFNRILDISIEH